MLTSKEKADQLSKWPIMNWPVLSKWSILKFFCKIVKTYRRYYCEKIVGSKTETRDYFGCKSDLCNESGLKKKSEI